MREQSSEKEIFVLVASVGTKTERSISIFVF